MPGHLQRTLEIDLPAKLMAQYRELERRHALLETERGTISTLHAGVPAQKLLQLLSSSVYDA